MANTTLYLTLIISILGLITGVWNLLISFRKERRERVDFYRKYEGYFVPEKTYLDNFIYDDEKLEPGIIIVLELKLINAPVLIDNYYYLRNDDSLGLNAISYRGVSSNIEVENIIQLFLHLKDKPNNLSSVDFTICYGSHSDYFAQNFKVSIGRNNRVDASSSNPFVFSRYVTKELKNFKYYQYGEVL